MGLEGRVARLEVRMKRFEQSQEYHRPADTPEEARAKIDAILRRVFGDGYKELDRSELGRLVHEEARRRSPWS